MVKKIPSRRLLIEKLHRYSSRKRLLEMLREEQYDQSIPEEKIEEEEKKKYHLQTPIKDHFYTFQLSVDLFTLLYTSVIFKWINTERVLILCETPKIGYKIELFLRSFHFNSVFLDKEMPINTNNHFYSQFIKGNIPICIVNTEYSEKSPNYGKEIVNNAQIPVTIVYFDCESVPLLNFHSYHINTRAIYHFIDSANKNKFIQNYEKLDKGIHFDEFKFDFDQMAHFRYRCEDMYNGIKKNDIKKEKMRKVNIELLHSKKMEKFFEKNKQEKHNVIKAIEENSIQSFRPSTSYIPGYMLHQDNNEIASVIRSEFGHGRRNRRRNKRGKMEEYLEALDKGDGSHNLINF